MCTYILLHRHIRFMPQGTGYDNLWPDRLVGPKALNPNYCWQPTLWLHDICLEVLTVHGDELHLFGANASTYTILSRLWHSSCIGITFNVFSYDLVWAENQTLHTHDDERTRFLLRTVTLYIIDLLKRWYDIEIIN